jgi:hypothetical protein
MDAIYIDQPTWSDDDDRIAEEGRSLFGILSRPALHRVSVDEFPKVSAPKASNRRADSDNKQRTKRKKSRKHREQSR